MPASSIPQGTALVLDTAWLEVLDRQQVTVLVSDQHEKNFTTNKVTILADCTWAFTWPTRPPSWKSASLNSLLRNGDRGCRRSCPAIHARLSVRDSGRSAVRR